MRTLRTLQPRQQGTEEPVALTPEAPPFGGCLCGSAVGKAPAVAGQVRRGLVGPGQGGSGYCGATRPSVWTCCIGWPVEVARCGNRRACARCLDVDTGAWMWELWAGTRCLNVDTGA